MLETLIKAAGHECIFLPKFYCELNPIEMVSNSLTFFFKILLIKQLFSTGDGVNTGIENIRRQILQQPRSGLFRFLMLAQLRSSGGLLTVPGDLQRLIGLASQGRQLPGLSRSRGNIVQCRKERWLRWKV
jgi:hypothetical protein